MTQRSRVIRPSGSAQAAVSGPVAGGVNLGGAFDALLALQQNEQASVMEMLKLLQKTNPALAGLILQQPGVPEALTQTPKLGKKKEGEQDILGNFSQVIAEAAKQIPSSTVLSLSESERLTLVRNFFNAFDLAKIPADRLPDVFAGYTNLVTNLDPKIQKEALAATQPFAKVDLSSQARTAQELFAFREEFPEALDALSIKTPLDAFLFAGTDPQIEVLRALTISAAEAAIAKGKDLDPRLVTSLIRDINTMEKRRTEIAKRRAEIEKGTLLGRLTEGAVAEPADPAETKQLDEEDAGLVQEIARVRGLLGRAASKGDAAARRKGLLEAGRNIINPK